VRLKQIDASGPLPDRYVQSNFEAMNAVKLGIEKSGFRGRDDTAKLIEALEGLEMKEGDDFPQGDKTLRKEDHQAFLREFIFDIKDGKPHILDVIPKDKDHVPTRLHVHLVFVAAVRDDQGQGRLSMSVKRKMPEQRSITRRRVVTTGAVGLGAYILVPAPWQTAFGQAKPFRIGTMQPLSGAAAIIGKTALVGVQMAADRINKAGGINGRPIELVIADYESKPDVGRRKAEKMAVEDNVDAHVGGVLSNVCLACMPVWEEYKIVNMVGVCLDTTMTTSKCSRYTFRPFDYAPAQAVAFAPYLVSKLGKKWHIAYADYAWGQSTRDAYAEQIKKLGGEVVGTTGIPIGTADMTPFLSKISGDFDGLFGIFFGKDGVTIGNQAYDLGLTRKYKFAGDGALAESTNLPALGEKIDGFVGINRYLPLLEGPLNTPAHKKFFDDAVARLKQVDPTATLPDRYVQSNFEAMNALKIGIEKSGFRGREDTPKLIAALEGLELKEGDDFPQGDKTIRKEDHQAFIREFVYDVHEGKYRILEVVPKEKTISPPACTFA
jgi:branched-chain amino acid transport system substrate-binding protein